MLSLKYVAKFGDYVIASWPFGKPDTHIGRQYTRSVQHWASAGSWMPSWECHSMIDSARAPFRTPFKPLLGVFPMPLRLALAIRRNKRACEQASKVGAQSSVWLLDEVDAALDEANQRLVATLLSQLVRCGSPAQVVSVSHNSAFLELCTGVLEVPTTRLFACLLACVQCMNVCATGDPTGIWLAVS